MARQHGVLTRQQALACGLTDAKIKARIRAGRWQRLTARVYATFTGPLPRRAHLWAVLLRAGRGAVFSHQTAAELIGLSDDVSPQVHVTVPGERRVTPVPGVVVHHRDRAQLARARHPSRVPPQTRVEETVLDLTQRARTLDDALAWVARACGSRLTTAGRIEHAMAGRAKVRWRGELSAALADTADGCHSLLELRYLRDVERAHGLPSGERQAVRARTGGRWYDDVYYSAHRTRVELDGRAGHPAQRRWREHRRDNAAVVEGDTVLRYGWTAVTGDACETAAQVAVVLRRHGWRAHPRPCGPQCVITKPADSS